MVTNKLKLFIIINLILCSSIFANSIGIITAINGVAEVKRSGKTIQAKIGIKLYKQDIIITKKMTKLQIIFSDETIMTLGQNTNLSIKQYSFEENKNYIANFFLQKGTIRASTGIIGKLNPQNFVIKTKKMRIDVTN